MRTSSLNFAICSLPPFWRPLISVDYRMVCVYKFQGGSNVGRKFLRYHGCWPAVIRSSKVWKRLWVCSAPFGRSRVAASATHRVTGFLHGQWKRHRCFCHLVPSAGGALGFLQQIYGNLLEKSGTFVGPWSCNIYIRFSPTTKLCYGVFSPD